MATYKVQANGNAPTGAKAGDYIETAGGTYQILDANKYKGMTAAQLKGVGVNYNPTSGYYSMKVNNPSSQSSASSNGITWTTRPKTAPTLQSDTDVGKAAPSINVTDGINWSIQPQPQSTGNVNTNTSYNGSYLNVDLGHDYQADINKYKASGDYYAAARAEAQRNAKINYLNSIGQNTGNYGTTTNYVSEYSGNNQGGQAYNGNWSYNDLKNGVLPDNWTTANIGGLRYKRDPNTGNIYNYAGTMSDTGQENWRLIGSGFNPVTGEATFNNYEDASQAAYDAYRAATGDYTGTLSLDYINRVLNGTQNQYAEQMAEKQYQNWLARIQAQQTSTNYRPGRNDDDGWSYDENGNLDLMSQWMQQNNVTDPNKRQILHVNSFETDPVNPDDYHNYGRQQYFYSMRNYR